jgi:hypothetical protein
MRHGGVGQTARAPFVRFVHTGLLCAYGTDATVLARTAPVVYAAGVARLAGELRARRV